MKEEFDALFAEHQKLLGELQAMRAVAQPEQEPDKYVMDIECTKCGAKQSGVLTVNTTPPQRKPLTDEQVREIAKQYALDLAFPYDSQTTPEMFARAIEAAHNIKE